jgi:hypothetical protein
MALKEVRTERRFRFDYSNLRRVELIQLQGPSAAHHLLWSSNAATNSNSPWTSHPAIFACAGPAAVSHCFVGNGRADP